MKRKNLQSLNFESVHAALKDYRDSIGKETKPYHYSNEISLMRHAFTGDAKLPFDFKAASRDELKMIRRVVCLNRRLIKMHVDYKQRKKACRQLVLKLRSKI
jgi:hypothetical protein